MSVVKSKRKPSQFEVFHHYYQLRKEISDLLLRDFGFSPEKAGKRLSKQFGYRPFEDLTADEQRRFARMEEHNRAFDQWFIVDERTAIVGYLRNLGRCLFAANEIYPQYENELVQRRLLQEEALGYCNALKQELQYAIETLPVDVNKYTRFTEMIQEEIDLIKGWRKSDNRFKKIIAQQPGCV